MLLPFSSWMPMIDSEGYGGGPCQERLRCDTMNSWVGNAATLPTQTQSSQPANRVVLMRTSLSSTLTLVGWPRNRLCFDYAD